MADVLGGILALARNLTVENDLSRMLQLVTAETAVLLGVDRVSVRVLDETGRHLLVGARAGEPLHQVGDLGFVMGEGLVGWVAEHRQPLRLGHADADHRFVARSDMRDRMRSFLGSPLIVGNACIGVLAAVSPEAEAFDEAQERTLELTGALCAPHVQIARLRRMSHLDPLTGALNRRGLDAWQTPSSLVRLAIATVDLDHFKEVNDRFGHGAGDVVLQTFVRLLRSELRREDAVVRVGGEEFLLVLPGAGIDEAAVVAERARHAIAEHDFVVGGERFRVTASFGVAAGSTRETRSALIERADAALYGAKRAGRNRVVRAV